MLRQIESLLNRWFWLILLDLLHLRCELLRVWGLVTVDEVGTCVRVHRCPVRLAQRLLCLVLRLLLGLPVLLRQLMRGEEGLLSHHGDARGAAGNSIGDGGQA